MTVALSKLNFRDIGGIRAVNGAIVRTGLVYRSEGPASFVGEHHAELGALGFRAVCDLRSEVERVEAPNGWCGPGCRLLNLDMNTDLRAQGGDIWDSLRREPTAHNARRVMMENYRMMPAALLAHIKLITGALIERETPILIHCTAGKDRTGVATALLLCLLGVGHDDILADYQKSDVFGDNMRIAGSIESGFTKAFGFVPSEAVVATLVGAHGDFLLAALDVVARDWGSIDLYFDAGGVSGVERTRLRSVLLSLRTEHQLGETAL